MMPHPGVRVGRRRAHSGGPCCGRCRARGRWRASRAPAAVPGGWPTPERLLARGGRAQRLDPRPAVRHRWRRSRSPRQEAPAGRAGPPRSRDPERGARAPGRAPARSGARAAHLSGAGRAGRRWSRPGDGPRVRRRGAPAPRRARRRSWAAAAGEGSNCSVRQWYLTVLSRATARVCRKARMAPRSSAGSSGRQAGSRWLAATAKRALKRGRKRSSTACASPMVVAEARRSSVTRRSWNVPAMRSTRPLACGERAKIRRTPSSAIARANWVDASPPARCWAEARKTAWRSL